MVLSQLLSKAFAFPPYPPSSEFSNGADTELAAELDAEPVMMEPAKVQSIGDRSFNNVDLPAITITSSAFTFLFGPELLARLREAEKTPNTTQKDTSTTENSRALQVLVEIAPCHLEPAEVSPDGTAIKSLEGFKRVNVQPLAVRATPEETSNALVLTPKKKSDAAPQPTKHWSYAREMKKNPSLIKREEKLKKHYQLLLGKKGPISMAERTRIIKESIKTPCKINLKKSTRNHMHMGKAWVRRYIKMETDLDTLQNDTLAALQLKDDVIKALEFELLGKRSEILEKDEQLDAQSVELLQKGSQLELKLKELDEKCSKLEAIDLELHDKTKALSNYGDALGSREQFETVHRLCLAGKEQLLNQVQDLRKLLKKKETELRDVEFGYQDREALLKVQYEDDIGKKVDEIKSLKTKLMGIRFISQRSRISSLQGKVSFLLFHDLRLTTPREYESSSFACQRQRQWSN